MAFPYINSADVPALFPNYTVREWLNEAADYAPVTESFTVPVADAEGRCRIELHHAIDVAEPLNVTVDGNALTVITYGASIGSGQCGVQTDDNKPPILEFNTDVAELNGSVTYTPIGTMLTAMRMNQIEVDLATTETTLDARTGPDADLTIHSLTTTGDVYVGGNLTYVGTLDEANITNLQVTDKNIVVNHGGNDATAEGAGIYVEGTSAAIKGKLLFDSSLASGWKIGKSTQAQVVTVSDSQTLTSKTLTSPILVSPTLTTTILMQPFGAILVDQQTTNTSTGFWLAAKDSGGSATAYTQLVSTNASGQFSAAATNAGDGVLRAPTGRRMILTTVDDNAHVYVASGVVNIKGTTTFQNNVTISGTATLTNPIVNGSDIDSTGDQIDSAVGSSHSQHTDSGTTSQDFTIFSVADWDGGPTGNGSLHIRSTFEETTYDFAITCEGDGTTFNFTANGGSAGISCYALNASYLGGDGAGISNINAGNISSGTLNVARLANITNTQISASAAIAYSKLALSNSIVNADIASGAAIADSKLATISSSGKVADTALSSNIAKKNVTNVFTADQQFNGVIFAANVATDGLDVNASGGQTTGICGMNVQDGASFVTQTFGWDMTNKCWAADGGLKLSASASSSAATLTGETIDWTATHSSGVMTNAFGLKINAPTKPNAGTITSAYGLYVEKPTIATSNYSAFFAGPIWVNDSTNGGFYMRPNSTAIECHIRPSSGKQGWFSFTENGVADRWLVGIKNGDSNLYFATGNVSSNTTQLSITASGEVTLVGTQINFDSGTASLYYDGNNNSTHQFCAPYFYANHESAAGYSCNDSGGSPQTGQTAFVDIFDNASIEHQLSFTGGILTGYTQMGCFTASTMITMADGSTKPISEVAKGDFVKSFNTESGEVEMSKVTKVKRFAAPGEALVINGLVYTDAAQHFYNGTDWVLAKDLVVGDTIKTADEMLTITTLENVANEEDIYDFFLAPSDPHSYFANGVLAYSLNYTADEIAGLV